MSGIDPRLEARRRAVQEQRARRSMTRIMVFLAIAVFAGGAAWVVLRSPWFRLTEIRVLGSPDHRVETLLPAAGVSEGMPLASIRSGAVETKLATDPWIASVQVRRHWPHTLVVTVRERYPVASVETASGWVETASDGVVLSRLTAPADRLGRVLAPGAAEEDLSSRTEVLGALEFLSSLRADLASSAVVDLGGEEIVAQVAGIQVRLGRPIDMTTKARVLASLLDSGVQEGSTITLVAPTRPAVAPPSSSTTTVGG